MNNEPIHDMFNNFPCATSDKTESNAGSMYVYETLFIINDENTILGYRERNY